jgi:uncharacterized protein (TIGR02145 family)
MTVDGQTYSTVEIGNQIWTASNVSIVPTGFNEGNVSGSLYWWLGADGEPAEYYTHSWATTGTAADEDGYYYTWAAAQNVCPAGWRLPSDQDWKDLEEELGMPAGPADHQNLVNRTGWRPNTGVGTELLAGGFNAKFAGQPHSNRGIHAYFWSSTESYYRQLRSDGLILRDNGNSGNSFSVRCLKNN